MTELDDFIDDLLTVAPAIATDLQSRGYDVRPDLEIPTAWAGWVGRSVAHVFQGLGPADRTRLFAVVERHLAGASESTSTVVATGFLEAVANAVSRGDLPGSELAEALGPQSRAYLDAYDQFTLGRSSLDPS